MDSLSRAEIVFCCFSSASHHETKAAVVGQSAFKDVNSKALFLTTYSHNLRVEEGNDMKGRAGTRQTKQLSF